MTADLKEYIRHLTPLQQAAVERIEDFKAELASRGMYVRSANEVEFATYRHNERSAIIPVYTPLNISGMFGHLTDTKNPFALPDYIERFDHEHYSGQEKLTPDNHTQYELTIVDAQDLKSSKTNWKKYDPFMVAAATDYVRKVSIPEALRCETCLKTPGNAILASFAAMPFAKSPSANHQEDTLSLHTNVSLYDEEGKNLMKNSPALLKESSLYLAEIQHRAGLGLLPNADSLQRIHEGNYTTRRIGVGPNQKNTPTVSVLAHDDKDLSSARNKTRLENRMPGADVDPYVSMAITLAALVETTRPVDQRVIRLPDYANTTALYTIPKKHEEVIQQFEQAQEMRTLLGAKLYDAIRTEYGKGASLS